MVVLVILYSNIWNTHSITAPHGNPAEFMTTILKFYDQWVLINGPTFNRNAKSAEVQKALARPSHLICDLTISEVGQLMGGN